MKCSKTRNYMKWRVGIDRCTRKWRRMCVCGEDTHTHTHTPWICEGQQSWQGLQRRFGTNHQRHRDHHYDDGRSGLQGRCSIINQLVWQTQSTVWREGYHPSPSFQMLAPYSSYSSIPTHTHTEWCYQLTTTMQEESRMKIII